MLCVECFHFCSEIEINDLANVLKNICIEIPRGKCKLHCSCEPRRKHGWCLLKRDQRRLSCVQNPALQVAGPPQCSVALLIDLEPCMIRILIPGGHGQLQLPALRLGKDLCLGLPLEEGATEWVCAHLQEDLEGEESTPFPFSPWRTP